MDYSLLLVVEYNKKYVERFPSEFAHDSEGNLILPVKPSKEEQRKTKEKLNEFTNIQKKQEITNEFMDKMCG